MSAFLGLLVSIFWYRANLYYYLESLSSVTTQFVRHSFGTELTLLEKIKIGLLVFSESVIGKYLFIALAVVLIMFIWKNKAVNHKKNSAVWICLLSIIPTVILFIVGTNNNSRYLAPILIPLAVVFGVMAVELKQLGPRFLIASIIGLMGFQFFYMVAPSLGEPRYKKADDLSQKLLWGNLSTVFERKDLWDWDALKELCDQKQIGNPSIRFLGNGVYYKPHNIAYPWFSRQELADIEPRLWRYEKGKINWEDILKSIKGIDVVLTAPGYRGFDPNKDYLDNAYNDEFAERLKNHPDFEGPVILTMGRFEPAEVYAFFRKEDEKPD